MQLAYAKAIYNTITSHKVSDSYRLEQKQLKHEFYFASVIGVAESFNPW